MVAAQFPKVSTKDDPCGSGYLMGLLFTLIFNSDRDGIFVAFTLAKFFVHGPECESKKKLKDMSLLDKCLRLSQEIMSLMRIVINSENSELRKQSYRQLHDLALKMTSLVTVIMTARDVNAQFCKDYLDYSKPMLEPMLWDEE